MILILRIELLEGDFKLDIVKIGNVEFNVADTNNQNHINHWNYVNNGSWEPETFKVFKQFLDNNHSYIDMGAWIGSTVLYGCQIAKHVYAAEPDVIALKYLKNNIKANPTLVDKITLYEGCIADRNGIADIAAPGGKHTLGQSATSLLYSKVVQLKQVELITFDGFINKYTITDCNFIKMDIEGAEGMVLPTMKEYIQSIKPVLYISFHSKHLNSEIWENIIDVLKEYSKFYDVKTMKEINVESIKHRREVLMV